MLDGAARLDELVAKAVADGQPALGITDHGNMYGTLEFYKECRKQGIKPVIGTEAYMAHDHRSERPTRRGRVDDSGGDTEGGKKLYYHLTLLAENDAGYRNLIQLSSQAFLEGYYYKPRLDWELLAEHHEGLIATTGCLGGHVLQSLLQGDEQGALEKAGRLQDIFGRDNLFVELQDHGLPAQRDTNPQAASSSPRKLSAPLLATNDSHYTHREDHEAHDALLCVQTGAVLSDPKRFKFEGHEHYLKTADEMRYLFREVPEACDNTLWIAERADVEIEFGDPQLPNFPLPEGFADDTAVPRPRHVGGRPRALGRRRARDGQAAHPVRARRHRHDGLQLVLPDRLGPHHATPATRGIRVGPGRGSAAGCAVAYCLRITDLDPIRYDLLFERFLNPSRLSMPDIDMDFDSRYRDEMIRYAAERYGRDHVAQIITFGTIKARNAVRDAARVLGFPYGVGDRIAKAMPPLVMGRDTPLKYCFEQHPKYADGYKAASELRAMYDTDPDVKKVVDVAKGLEGLKRSDGIHAAAVVITKEPLTEYLPVQRKPESGQDPALAPVVTQYEMHGVEELGLLKMDFLGLRNLDVITDTVEMLRRRPGARLRHRRHRRSTTRRRSSCSSAGAGIGVFQLEGAPMRALMRSLQPTSFDDVAALVALYRPGPMAANMHNDYADRKNGRKPIEYLHPDLEEVLGDTYGLMIYQESVMRVAQKIAGYSLAEADILRKAMGKKSARSSPTSGPSSSTAAERTGLRRRARQAAVRHHRAVRRLRVQQEPRLRLRPRRLPDGLPQGALPGRVLRLPADERQEQPGEGRRLHLRVPGDGHPGADARTSTGRSPTSPRWRPSEVPDGVDAADRQPRRDHVRAVGRAQRRRRPRRPAARRARRQRAVRQLPRLRRAGARAGAQQAGRRVVDQGRRVRLARPLPQGPARRVRAHHRHHADPPARAGAGRDEPVRRLGRRGRDRRRPAASTSACRSPTIEFDKTDKLRNEKEMLGLYVSDHPLFGVEAALRRKVEQSIADLAELTDGATVHVGGVITGLTRKFTKKGDQMAVFVLEDLEANIEVTLFPRTLQEHGHKLDRRPRRRRQGPPRPPRRGPGQPDLPVGRGAPGPRRRPGAAAARCASRPPSLDELTIQRLKRILRDHPGDSLVILDLGTQVLRLSDEFRVDIDHAVGELRMAFGHDAVLLWPRSLETRSLGVSR